MPINVLLCESTSRVPGEPTGETDHSTVKLGIEELLNKEQIGNTVIHFP